MTQIEPRPGAGPTLVHAIAGVGSRNVDRRPGHVLERKMRPRGAGVAYFLAHYGFNVIEMRRAQSGNDAYAEVVQADPLNKVLRGRPVERNQTRRAAHTICERRSAARRRVGGRRIGHA